MCVCVCDGESVCVCVILNHLIRAVVSTRCQCYIQFQYFVSHLFRCVYW